MAQRKRRTSAAAECHSQSLLGDGWRMGKETCFGTERAALIKPRTRCDVRWHWSRLANTLTTDADVTNGGTDEETHGGKFFSLFLMSFAYRGDNFAHTNDDAESTIDQIEQAGGRAFERAQVRCLLP